MQEVTINSVMADRLGKPELVEQVLTNFNKKSSTNIKRLKLKFEIFSLHSNTLLVEGFSNSICDSSSKEHGILDFTEINVKSCCGLGGRKIFMISQGLLAQDVEPRFQLFDPEGNRLESMEHLLNQPARDITILKEMIIFIAPPQDNVELIFSNNWEIKLLGVRASDNMESSTKFSFQYFPHDFYDPCIFCLVKPDGVTSTSSSLPAPISPAKPGLRKRKIEDGESKEYSKDFSRSLSAPVKMPLLTPLKQETTLENSCERITNVKTPSQTKSSRTTTLPLRSAPSTSSLGSSSRAVNLLQLEPLSRPENCQPGIYTSPQPCLHSPEHKEKVSPVSVIKYNNKSNPTKEPTKRSSLKTLHNIFKATNKRSLTSPPVSPMNDLSLSAGTLDKMLYTHPQLSFCRSVSAPPDTPATGKKMPELMNILRTPCRLREVDMSASTQWHSPTPPLIKIDDDPEPLVIKIEEDWNIEYQNKL